MRKILKFNKATGGANDANVMYYVSADEIKYFESGDKTCTIFIMGAGADGLKLDTIIITGGTGQGDEIADKLAELIHANKFAGGGAMFTIDVNFVAGITKIDYQAV
tara:strand:+ start:310 stop:627 length:318 start_codon:yes stop_codon:yes gene_type:complete